MPISQEEIQKIEERFLKRIAELRATPEERERILSAGQPFDYWEWVREAGPAKPEELAEMEEFLRKREREREWSLALEEQLASGPDHTQGDNE